MVCLNLSRPATKQVHNTDNSAWSCSINRWRDCNLIFYCYCLGSFGRDSFSTVAKLPIVGFVSSSSRRFAHAYDRERTVTRERDIVERLAFGHSDLPPTTEDDATPTRRLGNICSFIVFSSSVRKNLTLIVIVNMGGNNNCFDPFVSPGPQSGTSML